MTACLVMVESAQPYWNVWGIVYSHFDQWRHLCCNKGISYLKSMCIVFIIEVMSLDWYKKYFIIHQLNNVEGGILVLLCLYVCPYFHSCVNRFCLLCIFCRVWQIHLKFDSHTIHHGEVSFCIQFHNIIFFQIQNLILALCSCDWDVEVGAWSEFYYSHCIFDMIIALDGSFGKNP